MACLWPYYSARGLCTAASLLNTSTSLAATLVQILQHSCPLHIRCKSKRSDHSLTSILQIVSSSRLWVLRTAAGITPRCTIRHQIKTKAHIVVITVQVIPTEQRDIRKVVEDTPKQQAKNRWFLIIIAFFTPTSRGRCGVVGNTADSESVAPGSIPGTASFLHCCASWLDLGGC